MIFLDRKARATIHPGSAKTPPPYSEVTHFFRGQEWNGVEDQAMPVISSHWAALFLEQGQPWEARVFFVRRGLIHRCSKSVALGALTVTTS